MKEIENSSWDINKKITSDMLLFFDMDGTLVDTNLANFLSYRNAILDIMKSNYNLTYIPDKRFNRSALASTIPDLTTEEYDSIVRKKEEYYFNFIHTTTLIKETADVLFRYAKTNKIFLVTNSKTKRTTTTLDHFGITDKFSNIFCKDTNILHKTNKYKNAISILGIKPPSVIVFEDEEVEICRAIQAGIRIINPKLS